MTQPTPTPGVPPTPVVVVNAPSKLHIGGKAFVKAITSPTAIKLEVTLIRYVVYAIMAAEGIKHSGTLGF